MANEAGLVPQVTGERAEYQLAADGEEEEEEEEEEHRGKVKGLGGAFEFKPEGGLSNTVAMKIKLILNKVLEMLHDALELLE